MFCQNCGASLAEGAKFCPACGRRQDPSPEAAQNRCPACGEIQEPDAVFCDRCGQRLSGPPAPDAPRAQYTKPIQTSERKPGFTVSARPEVRVLGIPVRGKGIWIVLGILAAIVITVVILSRQVGGDNGDVPVRERAARQETAAETESEAALLPADSGGGFSVNFDIRRASNPAGDSDEAPTPEPEPTPEPARTAEPEPTPAPTPEPEPQRTPEPAPEPEQEPISPPVYETASYSTSDTPTLADFLWVTYEVLHGERPADALWLEDYDMLCGGWKCYLIDDPYGEYGSMMERLLNVYIDGVPTAAEVTFDWYYIHDGSLDQGYDDDGPSSVFSGSWSAGHIEALGPGSIDLSDFYLLDGHEYAVGTMTWPDGIPAAVFLTRP